MQENIDHNLTDDVVYSETNEFEQEADNLTDLDTPSSTDPLNNSSDMYFNQEKSDHLGREEMHNVNGDDEDDEENVTLMDQTTMGTIFHHRILLVLPLLYLAITPRPFSQKVIARALLAFVFLTLVVRLTASSPELFNNAKPDEHIKEMLKQSKVLIKQAQEVDDHDNDPPPVGIDCY